MNHRGLLVFLQFLALTGWSACSVYAAGPPEGAEERVSIFKLELGLGFWSIIVFTVLLLVLRKYAWGPMLEGLHKREKNIHEAIEEAQNARDEAQRLRDQFQREMDRAQEKVREIHDDARRRAQQAYDEMLAKARADIQTDRERLRREIDAARDQAIHELWTQTARLATMVAAKAIRREITGEDHRRLVDEAVAELGAAGMKNGRT